MVGIYNPGRLWRTLRHLKFRQISGRLWFLLARPRPDQTPPPPLRKAPLMQPLVQRSASLLGPQEFFFLNVAGNLAQTGWDDPARDKLWRYNQHYFDDLNAEGAAQRAEWHSALICTWIVQNPPGKGSGWEPYPTSLRIVNWVKWARRGNQLSPEAVASLAVQARWLCKRLEWHLLGNHLLANAKALVFAGAFFDGTEAESWMARGLRILACEFPEQILADGGHFELSPMYHALVIEDMLDLINIAPAAPQAVDWRARLPAMLHWLATLSHPDGCVAFFNDSAKGIAATLNQLADYAVSLAVALPTATTGLTWLADSGYARLEMGDAVMLADMARIGPDYLPGHAHADTLSCELSLRGQRVLVNSGCSLYGTGAERLRQRGTAAHNTVAVQGADSSEVWGGFRVGRRARVSGATCRVEGNHLWAEASHDGYAHLSGHPHHHRSWTMSPKGLEVEDRLVPLPAIQAEARWHLHPDAVLQADTARSGLITLADGSTIVWNSSVPARIVTTTWHPEFGVSQANQCLILPLTSVGPSAEPHFSVRASLTLTWA
jgi:uncharacterized heparinase superfamily protein